MWGKTPSVWFGALTLVLLTQVRPVLPRAVDYSFLSVEDFLELERSGGLLETGAYDEFLARSLFPSPLLCTGDSSRPEVRDNAPSYVLNNMATSPPGLPPDQDPLGALPDNWEMAYTESGEIYFIE
ncbi:hypothetical protein cypCar_00043015 [Cyprinus carpio]|nr:hypothetical protein cypCar_00043015 [Cyprinus carpio]